VLTNPRGNELVHPKDILLLPKANHQQNQLDDRCFDLRGLQESNSGQVMQWSGR
jgi:hypothetical protein